MIDQPVMTSCKEDRRRTLVANLNDVKDSLECTASGERFKNIYNFHQPSATLPANKKIEPLTKVFELPLNEFCNK